MVMSRRRIAHAAPHPRSSACMLPLAAHGDSNSPGSADRLALLEAQIASLQALVQQQQEQLRKLQQQHPLGVGGSRSMLPAYGASERQQLEAGPPQQHPLLAAPAAQPSLSPFDAQSTLGFGDRRLLGQYDARFHSTAPGATPRDFRVLPERIFLIRHAESAGNVVGASVCSTQGLCCPSAAGHYYSCCVCAGPQHLQAHPGLTSAPGAYMASPT